MNRFPSIIACCVILLLSSQGRAADLGSLVSSLKAGGHVIVVRHVATDDSQKDIYPFKFDDMTAQRQLSEAGREMARQLGAAFKRIGLPIGEVYTSRLNRAVETGKLLAGRNVSPVDELTDSGAGSGSAMANPDGRNAKTFPARPRRYQPQIGTEQSCHHAQDEHRRCVRERRRGRAGRGSIGIQTGRLGLCRAGDARAGC